VLVEKMSDAGTRKHRLKSIDCCENSDNKHEVDFWTLYFKHFCSDSFNFLT